MGCNNVKPMSNDIPDGRTTGRYPDGGGFHHEDVVKDRNCFEDEYMEMEGPLPQTNKTTDEEIEQILNGKCIRIHLACTMYYALQLPINAAANFSVCLYSTYVPYMCFLSSLSSFSLSPLLHFSRHNFFRGFSSSLL